MICRGNNDLQDGPVQGELLRGNCILSRQVVLTQLPEIDWVTIQLQHVSDPFMHHGNILGFRRPLGSREWNILSAWPTPNGSLEQK